MKTLRFVIFFLLVALIGTSACATATTPTRPAVTLTPLPTQTNTSTPVPPTNTPTPIPPTATDTPVPLILTDGTQQWFITSVTTSDTSPYTPPIGFFLTPGYIFLTIEFQPQENADMVSAVMNLGAAGIIKFSLPAGIKMVYVTDKDNNQYHAIEVAQTYFVIPVAENSSGFTLYVLDWEPVDLGK